MREAIQWFGAEEVFSRVDYAAAIRAVRRDLKAGLDPSADFDRDILVLAKGLLFIMPTESSEFVGVKLVTVAPGNPEIGKERVQGVYLMMDSSTLGPIALLDGAALTTLRTPAVSAAAAEDLAPEQVDHMVVFGNGTQALGHIEAMCAIRTVGRVTVVARNLDRAAALVARVRNSGQDARVGTPDDVRDAQLIVCATAAREPLFDGSLVLQDSCTVAVGSHEADARELPSSLIGRAQLVVEDVVTALREAGDVIIPIAEGVVDSESLVPLSAIVTGSVTVDRARPRVFKGSGMSWEDLVVASEVFRAR
jgi:ornithine cyclodeaminase/alanine dehydrogenase-like protein (mu-crystallin family)